MLREQLEVNVIGQVAVTQAFLPLLRRGHGRIINIGSMSGLIASPFLGPYAASKFALEALTDSLRVELLPWGIEVSIIEPGNTATVIWETSLLTADEMLQSFPPRAHELYGRALATVRSWATRSATGVGMPAERIATVVERALVAKRPKTRYRVGWDAALVALVRHLPDRARDRLMMFRVRRGPRGRLE
jgi:NAD(P)-dependent dehydrogenase (short-subunit alcohol dehydrogenase family)